MSEKPETLSLRTKITVTESDLRSWRKRRKKAVENSCLQSIARKKRTELKKRAKRKVLQVPWNQLSEQMISLLASPCSAHRAGQPLSLQRSQGTPFKGWQSRTICQSASYETKKEMQKALQRRCKKTSHKNKSRGGAKSPPKAVQKAQP